MRFKLGSLVASLALVLLAVPLSAGAQQVAKVPRIGYLGTSPGAVYLGFREGLHQHGYIEGQTMVLEARFSGGQRSDQLAQFARELVTSGVDVIAVNGTPATDAAVRATRTIPIVMTATGDPVGSGFVNSLARPGGNVTGVSILSPELAGKQLELLAEIVHGLAKVAVLWNSSNRGTLPLLDNAEPAAKALGITLVRVPVASPDDLELAVRTLLGGHFDALMVHLDAMFYTHRTKIVELASKTRLPAIYGASDFVDAGGLASYGVSVHESGRRAASYVDKILKGAKPADLPVEQPTKFELVINLKTAKALGLTIPRSLLSVADEVIQ